MMDDLELLKLAAKAAGIPIYEWVYDEKYERWLGARADSEEATVYWNPLTDDGDALRLAVDLRFDVCVNSAATIVYGEYDFEGGMVEDHGSDARAATRRAIVRAAAEQAKEG